MRKQEIVMMLNELELVIISDVRFKNYRICIEMIGKIIKELRVIS